MKSSEELWRDVVGYEGFYEISDHGNIRGVNRDIKRKCDSVGFKIKGRKMKGYCDKNGYTRISLRKLGHIQKFFIHRLVLAAFVGYDENRPQVNHKNSVRSDNRLENLEWCTQSENMQHAIRNNEQYYNFLHAKGGDNKISVPVAQYTIDGCFVSEYGSISEAAIASGARGGAISNVCRKRRKTAGGYKWKYI